MIFYILTSYSSNSYNDVDKYRSPLSGVKANTFFPFPNFLATSIAAKIAAADEIPTRNPS